MRYIFFPHARCFFLTMSEYANPLYLYPNVAEVCGIPSKPRPNVVGNVHVDVAWPA